jgi:hypothetical protein
MASTKVIEEFFLRIFKVTVLLFMGLALIAIVFFVATAAYQYSQSPKEPAPAQKAPEKAISLDDLKTYLIEQEKRKNSKEEAPRQRPGDHKSSLQFLENATSLFRCSGKFAEDVGAVVEKGDDALKLENLRADIERAATGPIRGEPWVKAAVDFTCKVLTDSSIITLKKEGKIGSVFLPTLGFHISAWDKIQDDKRQFEQREEQRVAAERESEEIRVGLAKASAITHVIAAGSAFGLFMLLALYLLGAKVENDLRDINEGIRRSRQQETS